MINMFKWVYKKITVSIIGQESVETDGTDIQIASGSQSSSAGTAITLATITVAPGVYCVIGDVDYFTTSTTGGTLTVSYTDPITTNTVTRYVALAAAGFTELAHDFRDHPFVALYNPSTATASVTITLSSTTTSTASQYIANAAYVLREPKL